MIANITSEDNLVWVVPILLLIGLFVVIIVAIVTEDKDDR